MNKAKSISSLIAVIFIGLMIYISELTGEKEIIFPEIAALTIGYWISPKVPWVVNKTKMLTMITLYAFMGVIIVKHVEIPLYFKVTLAFLLAGVGFILLKTTFFPVISAIILPILLNTDSFIYPISAFLLTLIIITVRKILEKFNLCGECESKIQNVDKKTQIIIWLKRIVVVFLLSFVATKLGFNFIIAPPMLVAFTEMSESESLTRNHPIKIVLLMLFAGTIGAVSRIFLTVNLGMPLVLSGMIAFIILIILMHILKLYFPPAGAIAILASLISTDNLLFYPIQILCGFIILTLFAINFFGKSRIFKDDLKNIIK